MAQEISNNKLFKVAKEINIGKEAIVEFLTLKGFAIDNKPTATLTDEMIGLIFDKFKKEKKAAEIQREKYEKINKNRTKEIKKTDQLSIDGLVSEEVQETAPVEKPIAVEPAPAKEAPIPAEKISAEIPAKPEAEVKKAEPKVEKPKTEKPIAKEPKTEETKPEETKPKEPAPKEAVPERIPLDILESRMDPKRLKASKRRDRKEEESKKPPEAMPKEHAEPATKPKSAERHDKKPKTEDEIAEKEAKDGKTTAIPGQADVDLHDELEPDEIDETGEETEEGEGGDVKKKKKRRKRKKIAEVEVEAGTTPKLKGLTIVGKIDLSRPQHQAPSAADKRLKKEKPKHFTETVEEEDDSKSKLKKGQKKLPIKAKEKAPANKKKRRVSIRELIREEDVDKAIKETLAEIGESSVVAQRARLRQKKKTEREEKEQRKIEEAEAQSTVLQLTEFVTTANLADMMNVTTNDIILKCMGLGLMVTINHRLDKDTITLIADDFGYTVEFIDEKTLQSLQAEDFDDTDEDLLPRSPVVTIMGHVDHGKTSLLDYVRNANVVAGEAGGITQHIGAYRVELHNGKHITFLDTPGHEAFTAMRARGAQVTDIVVLVVAADDSVMPQTIEAISHAKAAGVPIVVAVNKIDKPDANPDRIKQQLADYDVLIEEWGGKNQIAEISAKFGKNVDVLLEKILLEAELLDLKANPDRKARAAVIEANMDRGLGIVTTIIVQKGTLRIGDPFVAGVYSGRVRAMFDERGNKITEAGPSMPVRVIGFDGLPEAGDILAGVESDVDARVLANERHQMKREQEFRATRHVTLDDISKQIQLGGVKDLNLIIKADVSGSAEALSDSLLKQSTDEVRVNILLKGVGSITETDVMLAMASQAVIIGFQISPTLKARKLAEKESVDIRLYNIIYDAINDVRLALEGLLTPDVREDITSTIEVRKVFKISKMGAIAGCYVTSGKITRNDRVRLLRDGLTVYSGTLHSLKRNKDDVKEVDTSYECGIMLDGFNEFEEGDIIQGYKLTEIKRQLS